MRVVTRGLLGIITILKLQFRKNKNEDKKLTAKVEEGRA